MSLNKKTILTLSGFTLIALGFLTLAINFAGVDFIFMHWIKSFGTVAAFSIKMGMIMLGFILLYLGLVDLEREDV